MGVARKTVKATKKVAKKVKKITELGAANVLPWLSNESDLKIIASALKTPLRVKAIAKQVGMTQSAAYGQLRKLVKYGFMGNITDPHFTRSKRFYLYQSNLVSVVASWRYNKLSVQLTLSGLVELVDLVEEFEAFPSPDMESMVESTELEDGVREKITKLKALGATEVFSLLCEAHIFEILAGFTHVNTPSNILDKTKITSKVFYGKFNTLVDYGLLEKIGELTGGYGRNRPVYKSNLEQVYIDFKGGVLRVILTMRVLGKQIIIPLEQRF